MVSGPAPSCERHQCSFNNIYLSSNHETQVNKVHHLLQMYHNQYIYIYIYLHIYIYIRKCAAPPQPIVYVLLYYVTPEIVLGFLLLLLWFVSRCHHCNPIHIRRDQEVPWVTLPSNSYTVLTPLRLGVSG